MILEKSKFLLKVPKFWFLRKVPTTKSKKRPKSTLRKLGLKLTHYAVFVRVVFGSGRPRICPLIVYFLISLASVCSGSPLNQMCQLHMTSMSQLRGGTFCYVFRVYERFSFFNHGSYSYLLNDHFITSSLSDRFKEKGFVFYIKAFCRKSKSK